MSLVESKDNVDIREKLSTQRISSFNLVSYLVFLFLIILLFSMYNLKFIIN